MTNQSEFLDCACGDEIAQRRAELGYRTCLKCGERSAQKISLRKQQSVVETHKSNMVFVGEGPGARQYVQDIARMRRG